MVGIWALFTVHYTCFSVGAFVFHLRGARSDNTFWLFKNTLEPKTRTLRVVAAHLQSITAIARKSVPGNVAGGQGSC